MSPTGELSVSHSVSVTKNHNNQRPSATQSTACTGCVELAALRAPCLLRRLVASQLLASRALVASQLVRFADSVLRTSWDQVVGGEKTQYIIMQNPRVLYSINVITQFVDTVAISSSGCGCYAPLDI